MGVGLKTPRGLYYLRLAAPVESDAEAGNMILPLVLERADGIERVSFRCRVEGGSWADDDAANTMIERIAAVIERDFETLREAALKSIRTERKLLEIALSFV